MFLHYRSSSPPHTYARENRHHFVTLSMRDRFSTEVQRVYTDTQRSTRYGQTLLYNSDAACQSNGLSARRTLCFLLFRSCCQHRHVPHRADTLKSRNIHHRETDFQGIFDFFKSAVLQFFDQTIIPADKA